MSARELDIQEPEGIEDGIHDFILKRWPEDPTRHRGVAVQAGRFLPHATASAIWLAQVQRMGPGGSGHIYIEGLEWKGDHFEVFLGSQGPTANSSGRMKSG